MLRYLTQLMANRRGQALVEYVLIIALIAVVALTALQFFGSSASSVINNIANTVKNP